MEPVYTKHLQYFTQGNWLIFKSDFMWYFSRRQNSSQRLWKTGIRHFSNYFVFKELSSIFLLPHTKHEKEIKICFHKFKHRVPNAEVHAPWIKTSNMKDSEIVSSIGFPSEPGVLHNDGTLWQVAEGQQRDPNPHSDHPCSWASTASLPIQGQPCGSQLLGFVTLPGRQENWCFQGGTAAEIQMEKLLSHAIATHQCRQQGRPTWKSTIKILVVTEEIFNKENTSKV